MKGYLLLLLLLAAFIAIIGLSGGPQCWAQAETVTTQFDMMGGELILSTCGATLTASLPGNLTLAYILAETTAKSDGAASCYSLSISALTAATPAGYCADPYCGTVRSGRSHHEAVFVSSGLPRQCANTPWICKEPNTGVYYRVVQVLFNINKIQAVECYPTMCSHDLNPVPSWGLNTVVDFLASPLDVSSMFQKWNVGSQPIHTTFNVMVPSVKHN